MIKPGQRKKRRGQEGGEGAALPPPARHPPGLGPNKNLETVANSRLVATRPSPALRRPQSGALSTEPGRGPRGGTGGRRPRAGGWPPPPCCRAGTHRREAASVLADDGAEAQEAGQHDEGAREDEDVGRGGEGAGGQDAEVAALLHQGTRSAVSGPARRSTRRVRAGLYLSIRGRPERPVSLPCLNAAPTA